MPPESENTDEQQERSKRRPDPDIMRDPSDAKMEQNPDDPLPTIEGKTLIEVIREHQRLVDEGTIKNFPSGDLGETIKVEHIGVNAPLFNPSVFGKYGKFAFVKVKPCDTEKWPDGTYVGILLGDLPGSWTFSYNSEIKKLMVSGLMNPAILVLDKKTGAPLDIVWGAGSFWGIIASPDDLKDITDLDIENVWYVKALKAMDERWCKQDEEARAEEKEEKKRSEEDDEKEKEPPKPLPSWLEESAPEGDKEQWEDVDVSLRDKKVNFDFIHIWTGDDQSDNPTWTEFELEKTIVAVKKAGKSYHYEDVDNLPDDIQDQYKYRIAYLKLRTEGGNFNVMKYAPDTEEEAQRLNDETGDV